jgi:hypothetical protein
MNATWLITVLLALVEGGGAPPLVSPGPRGATSSVPTAAFAADGTLWLTWVDDARVHVSSSKDLGQTFSPPAAISPVGEAIDANGEARPKIAVGPRDEVYVSYTRKGEHPFTGDIRFSRRLPGGGFAEPVTVNDDGLATGHRFDTLAVAPNGEVRLVWIDKRDRDAAKEKGEAYDGAALYQAVSTDGGRTFSPNSKIKDGICECCRLAVAWDGATPLLLWRDILDGGIRDHSIARLDAAGPAAVRRATDDAWRIDGCPHHGPSLAIGAGGTWHLAWFTGEGKRRAGIFYRRSSDQGRSFSEPMRLGSAGAGRPSLLAAGRTVRLVWKEPLADGAVIRAMHSDDDGLTWSEPREQARTSGNSDHPLLVVRGTEGFLSWFTAREGYRLVPVP